MIALILCTCELSLICKRRNRTLLFADLMRSKPHSKRTLTAEIASICKKKGK